MTADSRTPPTSIISNRSTSAAFLPDLLAARSLSLSRLILGFILPPWFGRDNRHHP